MLNEAHPGEFVSQKLQGMASNFCGIQTHEANDCSQIRIWIYQIIGLFGVFGGGHITFLGPREWLGLITLCTADWGAEIWRIVPSPLGVLAHLSILEMGELNYLVKPDSTDDFLDHEKKVSDVEQAGSQKEDHGTPRWPGHVDSRVGKYFRESIFL